MERLPFWTLVAVLLVDVAWLVSLSYTPESIAEGWEPLLSYPNLGFAGFVALLVGAVIQSRGVVWIIALGMCVLGAVVWLLTRHRLPDRGHPVGQRSHGCDRSIFCPWAEVGVASRSSRPCKLRCARIRV